MSPNYFMIVSDFLWQYNKIPISPDHLLISVLVATLCPTSLHKYISPHFINIACPSSEYFLDEKNTLSSTKFISQVKKNYQNLPQNSLCGTPPLNPTTISSYICLTDHLVILSP